MSEIDLDDVLLSPEAVAAWLRAVAAAVRAGKLAGIDPAAVPDERGRVESDGSLIVFVPLPGGGEISVRLPPGAWARRQRPPAALRPR